MPVMLKAIKIEFCLPNFFAPFEEGEIGPDLFRHACLMGLEGLVCKHRESLHRGGRSDRWVKVKTGSIQHSAGVRDQFV